MVWRSHCGCVPQLHYFVAFIGSRQTMFSIIVPSCLAPAQQVKALALLSWWAHPVYPPLHRTALLPLVQG